MSTKSSDAPTRGCLILISLLYLIGVSIVALIQSNNAHGNFANFLSFVTPYMLFFIFCLFFLTPWGRVLFRKTSIFRILPYLLIIVLNGYLNFNQYSFTSPHIIFSIFMGCLLIFMFTPWFRYVNRWFPILLTSLILIGSVLILQPILTHPPINYFKVVFILFIAFGLLAFLLLFTRYNQNMNVRKEGVTFHVGQVNLPQKEALFLEEKRQTAIKFLGISISFTRVGKFWKFTLSTD